MDDLDCGIVPDGSEAEAGFSAQTLNYPGIYELPGLGSKKSGRLERAVSLRVDEQNRIKRCKLSEGYVHEVLVDEEWLVREKFSILDDMLKSDVYRVFLKNRQGKVTESGDI